jgi:hypothetical protein
VGFAKSNRQNVKQNAKPLPKEPPELDSLRESLNQVIRVLNESVVGKLEEIESRLDRLEK